MADFDIEGIASAILDARAGRERMLVAIAGPPASGKSTLSEVLNARLNDGGDVRSVVVPMDGFHLDNIRLDEMGLRHRKGAPETFDFDGFAHLLKRLPELGQQIYYPTFDRTLDKAIAGSGIVRPEDQIILVEGNYLLLDEAPWSQLAYLFDFSVFLDVPTDVLKSRLIQRWLDHDHSPKDAEERAMSNDIPNALRVCEGFSEADHVISWT